MALKSPLASQRICCVANADGEDIASTGHIIVLTKTQYGTIAVEDFGESETWLFRCVARSTAPGESISTHRYGAVVFVTECYTRAKNCYVVILGSKLIIG
ncbi:hypothetical protein INT43_006182 [Umbelopsis isabellina]|uniref:Uncharacterized protein n=1 Tax=Mortierella isabellina TaxID=91625 RepID=A0A8H7UIP9_MORIS|nr:hypothetical protein INT43_006182 [Umbelopsis isabellina]